MHKIRKKLHNSMQYFFGITIENCTSRNLQSSIKILYAILANSDKNTLWILYLKMQAFSQR
jgi:hypothetical protein